MGKCVTSVSDEAMGILRSYPFPGNIRELQNIIARGVAVAKSDTLTPTDLPPDLLTLEIRQFENLIASELTLESLERQYIEQVLKNTGGAKTRAAEILGIDRTSLWRKLKKYHLAE